MTKHEAIDLDWIRDRVEMIQGEILDTPCWHYPGKTVQGYWHLNRKTYRGYVHRRAYELVRGLIPEGLVPDHLCRDRACQNADHMDVVPPGVNTMRGQAPPALNALKTHCSKGHPFTDKNTAITRTGGRECRTCRRIWRRQNYRNRQMRLGRTISLRLADGETRTNAVNYLSGK